LQKAIRPIIRDLIAAYEGIQISIDGTLFTFFKKFLLVAGDNKGIHELLEMMTSFSSMARFCRFCYIHKYERSNFNIKHFKKRAHHQFIEIARIISRNPSTTIKSIFSQKGFPYISYVPEFNIIDQCPVDTAHSETEGHMKEELQCLLSFLIKQNKITMSQFNTRLSKLRKALEIAEYVPDELSLDFVQGRKEYMHKADEIYYLSFF